MEHKKLQGFVQKTLHKVTVKHVLNGKYPEEEVHDRVVNGASVEEMIDKDGYLSILLEDGTFFVYVPGVYTHVKSAPIKSETAETQT